MVRRSQNPTPTSADAEKDALRLLSRRPLTESELREGLGKAGHAPDVVGAIVERLAEVGQIDDVKLARHWVVARAERLGHGPIRLIGDLVGRGVSRDVAESVWREAVDVGDVSVDRMLEAQLRRRLSGRSRPLDRRAYARVYNALLRAGFPADAVEQALEPHRPGEP